MKITELNGHFAKLGPRSITIKDEYAKTRAVIRAVRFKELYPRDQMPLFKAVRDSGLWGSGQMDAVYVVDGKLYYLYNKNPDEYYLRHREDLAWTDMPQSYEKRQELKTKVEAQGITILPISLVG